MEHLWIYTSLILAIVLFAKILSATTNTVDVLWLIVLGAVGVNIGILPEKNPILEAIGDWGIVFVMFALGFVENVAHFLQGLKRSWGIAVIGAIFPFLAGYYTASLFGYDFNVSMIWGLTMTATAVSLTMVSLQSEGLQSSHAAIGIMTAAVVDDVLSLIGLSLLIPIAISTQLDPNAALDLQNIGLVFIKVLLFFIIILFIGIVLFPDSLVLEREKAHGKLFKTAVVVRRFTGVRKLLTVYDGKFTPLVMIFVAMSFGAIAHTMGFHPAIGAYFAGLFLKEEYFIYSKNEKLLSNKKDAQFVINHLAYTIFGPIFFVMLGTKLLFDMKIIFSVFPAAMALFTAVLTLQILSAALAARYTGSYKWHESLMIGFGMLGRAELAFIVIDIAYVENHLLTIEQFYILMITIFLLNIAVPMLIKWWKPYYQGNKALKILGITLSKKRDASRIL
ncbi:MAG TPA: cation:proton antiporter [Epsilonproteobacteria bacterium]|nr:cation:proton antiporter [Campylobacterota bacterium]